MEDDGRQERSRLIDHFKRVYTIIAGLAITEAVRRLVPLPENWLGGPALWLFVIFFLTIVPIFHGGDRSLDLKYMERKRASGLQRFWYLWDVYMLLITAMLFVAIAEAIPHPQESLPHRIVTVADTLAFFEIMCATLVFDVAILVIDRIKAEDAVKAKLLPYKTWIALNTAFAIVCGAIAYAVAHADSQGVAKVFGLSVDLHVIFPLAAITALGRTVWDYRVGKEFLFP